MRLGIFEKKIFPICPSTLIVKQLKLNQAHNNVDKIEKLCFLDRQDKKYRL